MDDYGCEHVGRVCVCVSADDKGTSVCTGYFSAVGEMECYLDSAKSKPSGVRIIVSEALDIRLSKAQALPRWLHCIRLENKEKDARYKVYMVMCC